MIIGILWGGGNTGRAVIHEALHRWHEVHALVRNASKLSDYQSRIHIYQGDATVSADMHQFLQAIDILVHAVSVPFWHRRGTDLYSQTTQTIIDHRSSAHVQQLIVMSSAGTHHGRKLPRPLNRGYEYFLWDVADDKEREELLLNKSSLPRTIIKAPLLTDQKAKPYTLRPFARYRPSILDTISRKTIAKLILDIAGKHDHIHQKIVPLYQ